MNRTMLRLVYGALYLLFGACMCVVLYYALWRSARGPWSFYLLVAIACGALLRKLHAILKRPDPANSRDLPSNPVG
jgi:4-hydroxybenzoate polyprenyltransferase